MSKLPEPQAEATLPAPQDAQAVAASPLDEAPNAREADRTVVGTVLEVEREFIWIETESTRAKLYASELMLGIGEVPADLYAPGDHFEAFVFQMEPDPNSGAPQFSIRRAAPYLDALNRFKIGSIVVNATVVNTYDVGIELDIDGLRGNAFFDELPLGSGESTHDRYQPGDTVADLFVWRVDHDTREFLLSVKRNAPNYVEALNAHNIGDVVSATVTVLASDGGLRLDAGGVIGWVGPQELSLASGESAQDRYAVGRTVDNLFVWQADRDDRILNLSVRRSVPGYVEALSAYSVGDVVSATVTAFQSNGGLWLDAGSVIGSVAPDELPLAEGESAQDRYAVGSTLHNLFVWQVNYRTRCLDLSVRRNAPGYVEALNAHNVGDVVSATITLLSGSLWLDVDGVIGFVPRQELALADGESTQDRYAVGNVVRARVWQIDLEGRDVALSVRRLGTDSIEETIALGATIDSVVREVRHGAIRVLVASQSVRILMCELSLGIGEQLHFKNGDSIPVVVLALDSDGKPSALSHRRALPEWQAAVDRLAPGVVVPDAQVVPKSAVPEDEDRAVVDLGPVNGFVRHDELDAKQAEELMVDAPNTQYPVVVDEINEANVIVSRARFEERWQELAEKIAEGDLVDAEFRRASRDSAIVDLGFGLLAEMPLEQLPTINDAGEQRAAREGDTFKVRITRKEDKEDSAHLIKAEIQNQWLVDLIAGDESPTCEFKAVFKGPKPAEPSKNREVYSGLPVLRAMAGLMNRDGGHVLVGITDTAKAKGNVIGWEASGFKSQNDLTTTLSNLVGSKLTPVAAVRYEPRFEMLPDGREILDIDCEPADRPVFLKDSGSTEFLVRQPAETKPLDAEEQHAYIQERFYGAASEG